MFHTEVTVRWWVLKLGLYMLQKGGKSVKKAGILGNAGTYCR